MDRVKDLAGATPWDRGLALPALVEHERAPRRRRGGRWATNASAARILAAGARQVAQQRREAVLRPGSLARIRTRQGVTATPAPYRDGRAGDISARRLTIRASAPPSGGTRGRRGCPAGSRPTSAGRPARPAPQTRSRSERFRARATSSPAGPADRPVAAASVGGLVRPRRPLPPGPAPHRRQSNPALGGFAPGPEHPQGPHLPVASRRPLAPDGPATGRLSMPPGRADGARPTRRGRARPESSWGATSIAGVSATRTAPAAGAGDGDGGGLAKACGTWVLRCQAIRYGYGSTLSPSPGCTSKCRWGGVVIGVPGVADEGDHLAGAHVGARRRRTARTPRGGRSRSRCRVVGQPQAVAAQGVDADLARACRRPRPGPACRVGGEDVVAVVPAGVGPGRAVVSVKLTWP